MSEEEVRRVVPRHGGWVEVAIRRARAPSALTPLVLVPGVGGPRETFYHQVEAFAADRDVIATSLNPAQAEGVEPIDSAARDVLAVLDALGVERADVLGASFGSCATARLTEIAPTRVRRQVWVAPPVIHHAPWRAAFGPGWLVGGAMMKFSPARYRGEVVKLIVARRAYSPEPDLSELELNLLAGRVTDTELAPFFRRVSGLRDWDWRRLTTPSPRPALVIQGAREHAVTPLDVRRAWERLSGRPIALTGGTHMPYLSFPQDFNRIVGSWLGGAEDASARVI
ncbi:MAG: alpha/beta hydrolase [Candidatus Eisenbacteria bacterium]